MVLVVVTFFNMRHVLAMGINLSNTSTILMVLVLSFCTQPLWAQDAPSPLSGEQIRSTLLGKFLVGEYDNGQSWSERFNRDQTTFYTEAGRSLKGTLTFKDNLACFEYPQDDEIVGDCFEVWQRGSNCFDFYGEQSTASIRQRQLGKGWHARAWFAGLDDTCVVERIA